MNKRIRKKHAKYGAIRSWPRIRRLVIRMLKQHISRAHACELDPSLLDAVLAGHIARAPWLRHYARVIRGICVL